MNKPLSSTKKGRDKIRKAVNEVVNDMKNKRGRKALTINDYRKQLTKLNFQFLEHYKTLDSKNDEIQKLTKELAWSKNRHESLKEEYNYLKFLNQISNDRITNLHIIIQHLGETMPKKEYSYSQNRNQMQAEVSNNYSKRSDER